MFGLKWLLQWPIRALVLLLISRLPLGVEMESFPIALLSAVVISLLGILLTAPLHLIVSPVRAITTLFGLIPIGWVYDWLISIVLFALAAWMIKGFRLTNGFLSAVLGALVYSVVSKFVLGLLGLEVPLFRSAVGLLSGGIA